MPTKKLLSTSCRSVDISLVQTFLIREYYISRLLLKGIVQQLWSMLEGTGTTLFSQIHPSDGKYMAQNYLAQMIALLGLPPKELVTRELEMRRWNFAPSSGK
jgi:hypothetical protein